MAVIALNTNRELYYLLDLNKNTETLIDAVDDGLGIIAFERVAENLGITQKLLAEFLRINTSTLARRKRTGSLNIDESERLYRLAFLLERSIKVIGNLSGAQRWLTSPKQALAGKTPLAFAKTEPGSREVEDLLGRIEYGIPS